MRRVVALIVGIVASCTALAVSCSPFDGTKASPIDGGSGSESDASSVNNDAGVDGTIAIAEGDGAVDGSPYALAFSKGGYVEVPFVPTPITFTVEAWIQPTAFPSGSNEAEIVAEDASDDENGQFRLGIGSDEKLFFVMSDLNGPQGTHSTGSNDFTSDVKLVLGEWTHVAVTNDGATLTLYVAGVAEGTLKNAFQTDRHQYPLRVGARTLAGDAGVELDPFSGTIDEVRIWGYARTAKELDDDMKLRILPTDSQYDSLVLYFPFDEGTGTIAHDVSAKARDAFLLGAPLPQWTTATAF